MSFLPPHLAHPYQVDPRFDTSVAYFSMECAIDQGLKIYSGGLGFLAGSHLRSAYDLKQNLVGIGMLWTYGYYHQIRGEDREMAVQRRKSVYPFLEDPGIEFPVTVHGHEVWVRAYYLPAETFCSAPLFLLSTDLEKNDPMSRAISLRLYDSDALTRIAQYIILGVGGAKLLNEIAAEPEVYHFNEAHALSAAFWLRAHRGGSDEELRRRLVFTTHTPEEAGNETHELELLHRFSFFSGLTLKEVSDFCGISGKRFNHSLAALRVCRLANGVSKLHGEVARKMWTQDKLCPITHITNAQNKKYWVDPELEAARLDASPSQILQRKRILKDRLFRIVTDQTGRTFDPDVLTIVWARRFAEYKRADLITRDLARFQAFLQNTEFPVQIIWAGKPYPKDQGAIDLFNHLVHLTQEYANAAVLVGYELALSKFLKDGADVWLNTPIVPQEASGTSGMTAAMNAAVNLSTYDGWICEFARDGENCFVIPGPDPGASPRERDRHDLLATYHVLENKILPLYYERPDDWWQLVLAGMNDVVPFFDSDRMATEYYDKLYDAPSPQE